MDLLHFKKTFYSQKKRSEESDHILLDMKKISSVQVK